MKLLIAVKSCQKDLDKGYHTVIRSTWGRDAKALGIDVKFFVAAEHRKHESDEIHLNCKDDYNSLPYKTKEICKWANGKMIDHLFLCDVDTFVVPKKLKECEFERYDYVGKIDKTPGVPFQYTAKSREGEVENYQRCYPWASGGYGYFLSRKAFGIVAFEHPTSWAEDLWVGQVLGPLIAEGEITALNTPRNTYSWHHPDHGELYDPAKLTEWLYKMHAEQK
jgi:hypothetical protein